MTARLNSCPFCGGIELHVGPYEDGLGFMPLVHCRACDSDTLWDEHCDTQQEASDLAVTLWNRRVLVAAPAGTAKASTCCLGEQLIPMRGSDTKICTGCKTEKHWPLEPGQKRTL